MSRVTDENNIPALIRTLDNTTEDALKRTGKKVVDRIQSGFDGGRDALGRPWAPLSPETVRRKGHSTILVDTGAMRDGFAYDVDPATLTLDIGTNVEYAIFHELGVPQNNLPARPMLQPGLDWALQENVFRDAFRDEFDPKLRRLLV